MPTDINPSQIPKLIPLGKLMGLPLRQTLTVVWHSGQFFDLPRLERGGLNLAWIAFTTEVWYVAESCSTCFKPYFFPSQSPFFSHMSQIAARTCKPLTCWWNLQGFVWFFLLMTCHGKNLTEIPLLMKSWIEGCIGGRMGRLVGFATTGLVSKGIWWDDVGDPTWPVGISRTNGGLNWKRDIYIYYYYYYYPCIIYSR